MDALNTVKSVVGLTVQVTTSAGESCTGTIYSYTTTPPALVLQIPTQTVNGNAFNYKFFRTPQIKNFQIISKQIDESKVAKISPVNPSVLPQIVQRNKEAVALAKKTRNANTTEEGQFIFNTVYKTIPEVKWQGNSIIVLGEVKIDPPYRVDSIKSILSNNEESDAISLVKKIVDGVWVKLENERKGG